MANPSDMVKRLSTAPVLGTKQGKIYQKLAAQDFGKDDSTIVSSLMNPIKAVKKGAEWFQNQVNNAAGTQGIEDYTGGDPYLNQQRQVEGATNLAGLANVGSMPLAPKSAGGTLGTVVKTIKQLEKENKYTVPKIPSGNVFNNQVNDLPYEARIAASDAFELGNIKPQSVNISDIIPTQRNITTHNLKSTQKYVDEPSNLVLIDGKYYVMDGHHRISNAILGGSDNINANVYEYNAKEKSLPQKPPKL